MESTSPKPFVFVLMPFHEDFRDIYELGIKQTCIDAGAYCERVDEQIFHENILERVYNQIAKADIIVADMTGRNPNVFYEVGYAHALNKQVILMTQNADDIPFDLKHYPHIVYNGKITALKSQLEPRVRWSVENPHNKLSNIDFGVEFYVDRILLVDNPQLPVVVYTMKDAEGGDVWLMRFSILMHNTSRRILTGSLYKCGIITPPDIYVSGRTEEGYNTKLPDNTNISMLKVNKEIFPDEWHTVDLQCWFGKQFKVSTTFTLKLRLFQEASTKDCPFSLVVDLPWEYQQPRPVKRTVKVKVNDTIKDNDIPF